MPRKQQNDPPGSVEKKSSHDLLRSASENRNYLIRYVKRNRKKFEQAMDELEPKDKVAAFLKLYDMVVPKEARNQLHQPVAPIIQINFTPVSKRLEQETIEVDAQVIQNGEANS